MKMTRLAASAAISLACILEYPSMGRADEPPSPPAPQAPRPGEVVPVNPAGDPRMKKAEWCDGCVIPVIAARGQTLPIEFPPGWSVAGGVVMASEQRVMDSRPAPRGADDDSGAEDSSLQAARAQRQREREAASTGNAANTRAEADAGRNGCGQNYNMTYCVNRERFLHIMPITKLTGQTFAVLVLETKSGKEIERNVVFDLSTTGNQYFSLRILPPRADPPPQRSAVTPATTRTAQRPPLRSLGCPPAGCLHQTQPQALSGATSLAQRPGSNANSSYTIQGDSSLIGGGK